MVCGAELIRATLLGHDHEPQDVYSRETVTPSDHYGVCMDVGLIS